MQLCCEIKRNDICKVLKVLWSYIRAKYFSLSENDVLVGFQLVNF